MRKKVLIIIASARKQSDTKKQLEKVFEEIEFDIIDLLDFEILPYNYCGDYSSSDKFLGIIEKILEYDKIVFATPVYWYAMSGLMKIFFDRLTDLVTINKSFGRNLKGKKIFLFAVGSDKTSPTGFEIPFELTAKYFHMTFNDYIYISTKHLLTNKEVDDKIKDFIENIKKH